MNFFNAKNFSHQKLRKSKELWSFIDFDLRHFSLKEESETEPEFPSNSFKNIKFKKNDFYNLIFEQKSPNEGDSPLSLYYFLMYPHHLFLRFSPFSFRPSNSFKPITMFRPFILHNLNPFSLYQQC